ncbi:MAG: glycogen debranching enzyme N-terminal domain-containing protein [Oligoflexia bacterium]|nr:glycogen debranching enzyme N-terminal domain-containing protein [Oligoflexia bacterium]
MKLSFSQDECGQLSKSLEKEWLETNGIGGYASSTIMGINTRKYHGLLTAAIPEIGGRYLLLSNFELSIHTEKGNKIYPLFATKYPGVIHPDGHKRLISFEQDLTPVTTYLVEEDGIKLLIEQTLMMVKNENTLLLQYRVVNSLLAHRNGGENSPIILRFNPVLAYRNIHHLTRANHDLNVRSHPEENGTVKFQPYNQMPALFIGSNTDIT